MNKLFFLGLIATLGLAGCSKSSDDTSTPAAEAIAPAPASDDERSQRRDQWGDNIGGLFSGASNPGDGTYYLLGLTSSLRFAFDIHTFIEGGCQIGRERARFYKIYINQGNSVNRGSGEFDRVATFDTQALLGNPSDGQTILFNISSGGIQAVGGQFKAWDSGGNYNILNGQPYSVMVWFGFRTSAVFGCNEDLEIGREDVGGGCPNGQTCNCTTRGGEGDRSGYCTATPMLPQTSGFNATGGNANITYTWNNINGLSNTSYNLYISTNQSEVDADGDLNFNTSLPNRIRVNDANRTGTVVSGLENGRQYYAAVAAKDPNSQGPASFRGADVPQAPATDVGAINYLTDTGIDWFANINTVDLPSQPGSFPGQDGETGKERSAALSALSKAGAGDKAFDFTKLDSSGNELASGASSWSCVRDNNTGLFWETKQNNNNTRAEALHDADDLFTWYNTDNTSNGGNQGTQNIFTQCFGFNSGNLNTGACNTTAFTSRVNASNLCGFNDWRLPSKQEFNSLVHYGNFSPTPAIDATFFANIRSDLRYWTSSSYALNPSLAWVYDFNQGAATNERKANRLAAIRLVRGSLSGE